MSLNRWFFEKENEERTLYSILSVFESSDRIL